MLNMGIALRDAGRKSEATHFFARVLEIDRSILSRSRI